MWQIGRYIEDHMGYRLTVTSASFPAEPLPSHARSFHLRVSLINYGFSAPQNRRPLHVVLLTNNSIAVDHLVPSVDVRAWQPREPTDPFAVPLVHSFETVVPTEALVAGHSYELGLWLPDERAPLAEMASAAIRFANEESNLPWRVWGMNGGVNVIGTVHMGTSAKQRRIMTMPLKTDDDGPVAEFRVANTLSDFGYYYALQPNATLPSVVAAHSTTTFADPHSFPKGVVRLRAANISVVISCSGLFLDPSNHTALVQGWQQNWDTYWASIAPYTTSILAFYPIDEPSPGLISTGAYGTIVRAIKHSAPHIPIAAVVTPSAVRGIEFGAFSLPPEVDWIGGDDYGCWGQEQCQQHGYCCWLNRTMPHNLGVLRDFARKRGSKVVVVPDGVASPSPDQRKRGEKALPSAAQQAVRAARDRSYYQWCLEEELCVAMWVFLWRSVHTASGWLTGVEDQREVLLPALADMGTAIKHRHNVLNTSFSCDGCASITIYS
jgi:hypothetical protein